jgi:hypothetical protein
MKGEALIYFGNFDAIRLRFRQYLSQKAVENWQNILALSSAKEDDN